MINNTFLPVVIIIQKVDQIFLLNLPIFRRLDMLQHQRVACVCARVRFISFAAALPFSFCGNTQFELCKLVDSPAPIHIVRTITETQKSEKSLLLLFLEQRAQCLCILYTLCVCVYTADPHEPYVIWHCLPGVAFHVNDYAVRLVCAVCAVWDGIMCF